MKLGNDGFFGGVPAYSRLRLARQSPGAAPATVLHLAIMANFPANLPMELRDVMNALQKLSVSETRLLAFFLGVPHPELDDINASSSDVSMRKCRYIEKWLDNDLEQSWEKLACGLERISKILLARKVRCEHPTPTSPLIKPNQTKPEVRS